MGWFNKLFAKTKTEHAEPIRTETKSRVLGTSDALGRFLIFGSGGASTPTAALGLYNDSTAVSIPINMVADSFAQLTPVLRTQDDVIITNHPVLDLLKMPNPFFTEQLFLEFLGKNFLITGETGLVALGGIDRPPIQLQPISSANVSAVEGPQGFSTSLMITGNTLVGNYIATTEGKKVRYLDGNFREFKQMRSYSTENNSLLRGQSLLVSAAAEARQHISGNTHNFSLLENGGRTSLVFHFEEDLNNDDFNETRQRVMDQYAGPGNAGRIGVTAGGSLDIKNIGNSAVDMDFANLQNMAKQAVALQYRVPLPLVTIETQTFDNYKEAKLALYDDAVIPLANKIFGGLSDFLLPRYGLDPQQNRITFDIDKITALALRRNSELKLKKELGVFTTNELRRDTGTGEITNGDQVLVPVNLIPLGNDLFTDDQNIVDTNPRIPREEP